MSKLQDRLDSGYYDMRDVTYPEKPKITFSARSSGLYAKELAKFHASRGIYQEESAKRHNDFREDLLKEHGLSDHPKADAAFTLAWEEKHSNGYGEVVDFFYDLASLLSGGKHETT